MLRRMRRLLFGRVGRAVWLVLVVALVWHWWSENPRPLRAYDIDGSVRTPIICVDETGKPPPLFRGDGLFPGLIDERGRPMPACGGNVIFLRSSSRGGYGVTLFRLADGAVLWKQEWSRSLTTGPHDESAVVLTPDRRRFVCRGGDGLHLVESATGQPVGTVMPTKERAADTLPRLIRFSADGRRFAVENDGVAVYDADTALRLAHFKTPQLPGPYKTMFDISPDGQHVLAETTPSAKSEQAELTLFHVDTGRVVLRVTD